MTTVPLNTVRALAQFNKVSGAFICFLSYVDPSTLDHTYFTYTEVYVDIEKQTVKGKYPSFQIVTVAEQPTPVYERVLNAKCRDKIMKEYALETQIDILRSIVQQLAEIASKAKGVTINDLAMLQEMNAYIDEVKQSNKVLKASYQNRDDYQYISMADENRQTEEQMEGGLHELVYGPRPINL